MLSAMGDTGAPGALELLESLGRGDDGVPRRVIGITGSAGKTTTKEAMVAAVLAAKFSRVEEAKAI